MAEQEKHGAIGQAQAAKEKEIRVAENVAESEKGKKKADAERRVYVQQQETMAAIGEADADREKEIKVAENLAQAEKGRKKADADKRIYVQQQEALAIAGENTAKADIANAEAELAIKRADAEQRGEVAKREALVEIQKAQYRSELERLNAEEIVKKEIEKRQIEIAAEAEAEKIRREAKGQADAVLLKYEAEARGLKQVLESKAAGYAELVKSCAGDAKAAATLLMIERIEQIVTMQVEAVKNLKIDKITVWDSGGDGKNGTTTANFLSGFVKSLPPLHDIAEMAGLDLPKYLGRMSTQAQSDDQQPKGSKPPAKERG